MEIFYVYYGNTAVDLDPLPVSRAHLIMVEPTLSETCLKWQRRSKVPPNARCVPPYERNGWVPPWSISRATHRKGMIFWTALWLEIKRGVFTTLLKVRRWWGARRSHDVVQRAGGRLLWLGDTEAGSST